MTEGTSRRASGFIRSNILELIAIFIALSGTAIALPGKNKVDSGDIKNGHVRAKDLASDSVGSSKVAANTLTGEDIDESSLRDLDGPSGSAGGDLAGTYPNPTVNEAALDLGGEVGGTVANANVDEETLGLGGDLDGTVAGATVDEAALGLGGDLGGTVAGATVDEAALGLGGDLGGTVANATVNEAAIGLGGDLGGTVANATVTEAALSLGGELSGTVANAQIQPGVIGPLKLANNAVVGGPGGDLQDGTLTGADIQNDSLTADDIDETNLNPATVNGLQVIDIGGNDVLPPVNGMSMSLRCFVGSPNKTVASVDSHVDNSKVYAEMSSGNRNFDADLDEAEPTLKVEQSTAGGSDSGHVTVRFQNGANGRVVTAELAWFSEYANCGGFGFEVTAFGRVIG